MMNLLNILSEKFSTERAPLPADMVPSLDRDTDIIDNQGVIDYMEEEGWKLLGSGANAMAFGRDNYPWILRLSNFDPHYVRFWNIVRRSENPHFPTVTKYGKFAFNFENENHVGFYTMVEKLNKVPKNALSQAFTRQWIVDASRDYINDGKLAPWIEKEFPRWKEALDLILSSRGQIRVNKGGYTDYLHEPDIHPGNIMWRGDIPVIVDGLK